MLEKAASTAGHIVFMAMLLPIEITIKGLLWLLDRGDGSCPTCGKPLKSLEQHHQ